MSVRPDPGLLAAELRARRDNAQSPFEAAVWSLLGGDPSDGLERIRRFVDEGTWRGHVAANRTTLAAVVGDWDAAERDATEALPDTARYVAGWREYVRAMLPLFAGDDAAAATGLTQLDEEVATRAKLRSGQPAAIADIPHGLLERDADRLAAGLDALLAWHLRRARARSEVFNSARGVVAIEAIGALLLADRRGLSVPVAHAYRAARVPLLVLYLREWNGEPLPRGMPLQVETDLVAGPWLDGRGLADGEAGYAGRSDA